MARPILAAALVALLPTIAVATPAQDLNSAFIKFDNHKWAAARDLARAYLIANGRDYSAELIVAGSQCMLHPHLKSNGPPFVRILTDYVLPTQQRNDVSDWFTRCTTPPPPPPPQTQGDAGVSVAGLSTGPNTIAARPPVKPVPLRHPPVVTPPVVKPPPIIAPQVTVKPPVVAHPVIVPPPVFTPPKPAPADACADGYVWREAFAGDHVCVVPARRTMAAEDNAAAASRVDPAGAYGPATCIAGYVWREAGPGDTVCVLPPRRSQAKTDNAQAGQRLAN